MAVQAQKKAGHYFDRVVLQSKLLLAFNNATKVILSLNPRYYNYLTVVCIVIMLNSPLLEGRIKCPTIVTK